MSEPPEPHLLHDFGALLWERAQEAVVERENAPDDDRAFEAGRAMGMYEAVSLLRSQAEAFGVSPAQVGLPEAEPEELL